MNREQKFTQFRRKQIAELRPYVPGEGMEGVSISQADMLAGSPKQGDMIARNPKNHEDVWLVAAQYFVDNFEPLAALSAPKAEAEEPCPVCAKPFAAGDTCATDIELGKCHAECLADSPTVDLKTGEPVDGPISTFPHVAPKAEAVAWRREWNYRGHKCAPEFTDSPGLAEQWETHPQTDKVIPLYTSPVPALTDEAVERAWSAWQAGKEDYGPEAMRAALLAAFPSKGDE